MKKFLSLFLSVCISLTLCSCTGNDKGSLDENDEGLKQISQKYDEEYQTTANIEYNGTKIKVDIKKDSEGTTEVTFVEPKMLEGMSFAVEEDNIKVSYLGMTFNIDPENLSSSIIVSTIVSAFNTVAAGSGITAEVDKSTLNVSGNTNNANFMLVLDKKTGNALTLEIPSMNLSAEFENFKLN